VPHRATLQALLPLWPVFLSYLLSFVYVGIYWNNHHHLLQTVESVDGSILWANLHLLFWLSLLPFATGWMGENAFARWPTVWYGLDLLLCAQAYFLLQHRLIRHHGRESLLARAVSRDTKGKASTLLYLLGIGTAWTLSPPAGLGCFVAVALIWLVPDRRLERALARDTDG